MLIIGVSTILGIVAGIAIYALLDTIENKLRR